MAGDRTEILGDCRLLDDLLPEEAEAVLRLADFGEWRRKDSIFRQGEPVTGMYILAEGRVKLSQLGPDGQEMIMRLVGPGDVFAAVAALDDAELFPITACALTDVRAAFWPRKVARNLVHRFTALEDGLLKEMASQIKDFQCRLREVATERVGERLAHLIARLAKQAGVECEDGILVDFPLTRKDLAEMTGTTLYTVSRLLSEWSERGLVDIGRARLVVRSPEALNELRSVGV